MIMTSSQAITYSVIHHLGIISLHRHEALNALNHAMIQSIQLQLMQWEHDADIHAMVIKSELERAFCVGGDIRAMHHLGSTNRRAAMHFFRDEYRLNHFIHALKKPYVALMDGLTLGGGVGISLHGSHPIATERFQFGMPETTIGFFPDIGASHLLSRCPDGFGMYLGLTGNYLDAFRAKRMGLVSDVVDSSSMSAIITTLTRLDLSHNPHQTITEALAPFRAKTPPHAINERITPADWFLNPSVPAIMDALMRDPRPIAQETHQLLQTKSPTSLQVTFERLLRAKNQNVRDCFAMDYTLAYHFLQHHDLYEGVRARLIDKDNTPHWKPSSLSTLTNADINRYFNPPPASIPSFWDA